MTPMMPSNRPTLAHEIRDTATNADVGLTDEGTCTRALLTLWDGVSYWKVTMAGCGRHYLWKIAPLYPCGREFTLDLNEPSS